MTFVNKYLSIYVSDIESLSVIAISLNEVTIILRVFVLNPDISIGRLILAMDPRHGEISRAMRNRGVEIYMLGEVCGRPVYKLVINQNVLFSGDWGHVMLALRRIRNLEITRYSWVYHDQ